MHGGKNVANEVCTSKTSSCAWVDVMKFPWTDVCADDALVPFAKRDFELNGFSVAIDFDGC